MTEQTPEQTQDRPVEQSPDQQNVAPSEGEAPRRGYAVIQD
ncbi:MAG: hypothetical protein ACJAR5_004085, partial [Pseudophaeobacter arcticus]